MSFSSFKTRQVSGSKSRSEIPSCVFDPMYRPFTNVAVERGIFIISNLLRQKTDTNTILASHGVMSSLVKLFSVKFQPLTNIDISEVGASLVVQRNSWNEFSFWPLKPQSLTTDIIDHGGEKYIDSRLVVLPSFLLFLGHKVVTVGLTFLSIKNLGGAWRSSVLKLVQASIPI